jgi:putative ubiquitin-RnfH superfamily antitoxin RatB of RatAB toxin-antitoxin module
MHSAAGPTRFSVASDRIAIEVACALPDRQLVLALEVPTGCTAGEALALSGIFGLQPVLDPAHCTIGIFGHEVGNDRILQAGDRVEVLRPLLDDPRERRRRLARQGATMGKRSAGDR